MTGEERGENGEYVGRGIIVHVYVCWTMPNIWPVTSDKADR